jgi:hypothetical protein
LLIRGELEEACDIGPFADGNYSKKTLILDYHAMWKVDVDTGELSYPNTKKRYEAEDAILTGSAGKSFCCTIKSAC